MRVLTCPHVPRVSRSMADSSEVGHHGSSPTMPSRRRSARNGDTATKPPPRSQTRLLHRHRQVHSTTRPHLVQRSRKIQDGDAHRVLASNARSRSRAKSQPRNCPRRRNESVESLGKNHPPNNGSFSSERPVSHLCLFTSDPPADPYSTLGMCVVPQTRRPVGTGGTMVGAHESGGSRVGSPESRARVGSIRTCAGGR